MRVVTMVEKLVEIRVAKLEHKSDVVKVEMTVEMTVELMVGKKAGSKVVMTVEMMAEKTVAEWAEMLVWTTESLS